MYLKKNGQTTKIYLHPDYNHGSVDWKIGAACLLSASRFRICNLDCRIYGETSMINETQCIVVNPTTNVFAFRIPTVCRPVAKVDRLLDALQNYSAVNCFKNSITKVILCLKA